MLKTLAARAVVPVAIAITGFAVVASFLLYSFIHKDWQEFAVSREVALAELVLRSTRATMLASDWQRLEQTVSDLGSLEGVSHLRVFDKQGEIIFSAKKAEVGRLIDKKSAGCVGCHKQEKPIATLGRMDQTRQFIDESGLSIMAITVPIANEPECSSTQCHASTTEQEVLGTIDIGLEQSELKESLGVLGMRLTLFCLMVMILSTVGVLALLRQRLFQPIYHLLKSARRLDAGQGPQPMPRGVRELEELGQLLHRLAKNGFHEK